MSDLKKYFNRFVSDGERERRSKQLRRCLPTYNRNECLPFGFAANRQATW